MRHRRASGRARGVLHHRRRIAGDAFAMERGLHHAALAEMEFAFTREEAVAEEDLGAFEDVAFDELFLVRHEHIAHGIWMREQHQRMTSHSNADGITVLSGEVNEEIQRIA